MNFRRLAVPSIGLLTGCVLGMLSSSVNAAVILTTADALNNAFPPLENGFTITYAGNYGVYGGGDYVVVDPAAMFTITAADSGLFTFNSIDGLAVFGSGGSFSLVGTLANLSTVTDTINITGSTANYLPVNLLGASLVQLQITGGFVSGGYAGFANVNLDEGGGGSESAPEPASIAIVGASLAGLGFLRRRKRA